MIIRRLKIMMNHYNDPYTEARMANVPIAKDDGNGNPVRTTFTEMTPSVQKHIRDTNNPIELNYKTITNKNIMTIKTIITFFFCIVSEYFRSTQNVCL